MLRQAVFEQLELRGVEARQMPAVGIAHGGVDDDGYGGGAKARLRLP